MKLDLNKKKDCYWSIFLFLIAGAIVYYYYYHDSHKPPSPPLQDQVQSQVGGSGFGYPIPRNLLNQTLLRGPYRKWKAFHYPYQSPWGFYQSPWLYYQQPHLLSKFDYYRSTVPTYYSKFSYTYNNPAPRVTG